MTMKNLANSKAECESYASGAMLAEPKTRAEQSFMQAVLFQKHREAQNPGLAAFFFGEFNYGYTHIPMPSYCFKIRFDFKIISCPILEKCLMQMTN